MKMKKNQNEANHFVKKTKELIPYHLIKEKSRWRRNHQDSGEMERHAQYLKERLTVFRNKINPKRKESSMINFISSSSPQTSSYSPSLPPSLSSTSSLSSSSPPPSSSSSSTPTPTSTSIPTIKSLASMLNLIQSPKFKSAIERLRTNPPVLDLDVKQQGVQNKGNEQDHDQQNNYQKTQVKISSKDQIVSAKKMEMKISAPSALSLIKYMYIDAKLIPHKDPACPSLLHAIFFSPGLWAVWNYRISHWLWECGLFFVARMLSTIARVLTSVEIHPGAKIGSGFLIDHGSGVVIGETAIVGDNVTLYQGVTLGGTGKESGKRHPTLGSDVVVGSGAKILGNIRLGDSCKVGAGSVVVKDVPDGCTVIGVPGRIVKCKSTSEQIENFPDMDAQAIRALYSKITTQENEINKMKSILANIQKDNSTSQRKGQVYDKIFQEKEVKEMTSEEQRANEYLMMIIDGFVDGDGI